MEQPLLEIETVPVDSFAINKVQKDLIINPPDTK